MELPEPPSRKPLLLGVAALAIVGLGAGAAYFALSSDGKPIPSTPVAAQVQDSGELGAAASPSPTPSNRIAAFRGGGGKDPFAPLAAPKKENDSSESGTAGGTTTGTTSGGATGGTTTGLTTGGTASGDTTGGTAGTASGSTTGGTSGTASTGKKFTLVSISGTKATIKVDGKTYTASANSSFGSQYRLGQISGDCTNVQYRPDKDSYIAARLCEGQSATLS
jgi:hypothetical protein